jgi:hypothetical protein
MTIEELMTADHERLDALLRDADHDPEAYHAFRAGLLRHISMEEKILMPAMRTRVPRRLHQDHGAIASLLVPTPNPEILKAIRTILERHNPLEEGEAGLYRLCDEALGADVLARLQSAPEVPLMPNSDGPLVRQHVARLLQELQR